MSGCFIGFLCQHLFVNSQTDEVNPSALASAGLGGLSPFITMPIILKSVWLGNGSFPVYN